MMAAERQSHEPKIGSHVRVIVYARTQASMLVNDIVDRMWVDAGNVVSCDDGS